jgi:acetoin utilization protein AcuC
MRKERAMSKKIHLVHSDHYQNWIFDTTHPTQGRRFTNARNLLQTASARGEFHLIEVEPRLATRDELARVHADSYIDDVLDHHISSEWSGERPDLSHLAQLFVGGTLTALDLLLTGEAEIAVNLPGAKHHAQYDHSSGFCIFNDFAIAADIASMDHGKNVLIIDIDGHHGDGTENLMFENRRVITCSIHEWGIFPGTGNRNKTGDLYNFPLAAGGGDERLFSGINFFIRELEYLALDWRWRPDLLFIACGADGHKDDPLTHLNYSLEGYVKVARLLRETFGEIPILVGGAGGYLPDSTTPEVWSRFISGLIDSDRPRSI